jgi:diguanylate cyclase (GGDEF)-like protein
MVDLDGFKLVNDRYGHDEGDQVLRKTAGVLLKNVRAIDTVARFGGDEFVVVLPETPADQAEQIAQRILQEMSKKDELDAFGVVSASLGIASAVLSADTLTPEDIIRQADHAMLVAKRAGKNRTCHFDACLPGPLSVRATRDD